MANKQKETMEEIPDELPKIVNNELNEEAEYRGAKQNEEDLLLTAQRYLNIFHQIHIFKEKKKEKFHKSLLKMPEKIRKVMLSLAGGRSLLEYIEELEEKQGFIDGKIINMINASKTPVNNPTQTSSSTSEIAQNNIAFNQNFSASLSEILRESKRQQIEMMQEFGKELSTTFLAAQKELISSMIKAQSETQKVIIEKAADTAIISPTPIAEPHNNQTTHSQNIEVSSQKTFSDNETEKNNIKSENEAMSKNIDQEQETDALQNDTIDKQHTDETATQNDSIKHQQSDNPTETPLSEEKNKTSKKAKVLEEVSEKTTEKDKKRSLFKAIGAKLTSTSRRTKQKTAETQDTALPEKSKEEKNTSAPTFNEAMEQIKDALQPPETVSLNDLDVTPVSLEQEDDGWEYVDEEWNTDSSSDESEWEYVDENGNPIDSSDEEWEYVDSDGNPVEIEDKKKS